jgi:hypothetical protein
MIRKLFGSQSHVPSDLLLLDDTQSIQIKKCFGSLAVCRFNWKCHEHYLMHAAIKNVVFIKAVMKHNNLR